MAWQDRQYNREDDGYRGDAPPVRFVLPTFTPLSLGLMVTCLAIFIVQSTSQSAGNFLIRNFSLMFMPGDNAWIELWRWVTYQYLHGGGSHLFWNMLGIYFFVPWLEGRWGWRRTLVFYTVGGVVAGLTFALMSVVFGEHMSSFLIGASGAELAVLGACAYFFGDRNILAFFVIQIPIRVLVALMAVLYLLTVLGDKNLSDAAHLGGLAFGFFGPWLGGPTWQRFTHAWARSRTRRHVQSDRDEQAMVDRILEKVHTHGMNSLTWSERRALRKATDHQRQRDREVSRTRRED
jgi:membrane associated rhomboid family serine protease